MKKSLYQKVTHQIIAMMETAGTQVNLPWYRDITLTLPCNASTEATYSGINTVLLLNQQVRRSYATSTWATYKQWESLDCQVKKDQRSVMGIYYKPVEVGPDQEGDKESSTEASQTRTWMMPLPFFVFNAD